MAFPFPKRRLGRTNLEVTPIGMGGAGIGGSYGPTSERAAVETVELALNAGINLLDTSPLYVDSERRLGLALKGVPRSSYVLTTKTGTHPKYWQDYSWDGTHFQVENSLKLIGTDYIDVLLIHDPDNMAPVLAERGALEALESLRAQKVIGNIGIGVRSHGFLQQAIKTDRFDLILTYNDYHPIRTTALTEGLLEVAAERDIAVLNGSPMSHGMLALPLDAIARFPERDPRCPQRDVDAALKFVQFCQRRNVPVTAVVHQFCLRQPRIHATLTGAKTPAELQENLDGLNVELTERFWEALDELKLTSGAA